MKNIRDGKFGRVRLMAIVLLVGLVGASSVLDAEEGEESYTLRLIVTPISPATATFDVDSNASFSVTFDISANNTGVDVDRTFDGTYTLTVTGGLTVTLGPTLSGACTPSGATTGTFASLGGGPPGQTTVPINPCTLTWQLQAPTGAANGSVTLTAQATSTSGTGTNNCALPGTNSPGSGGSCSFTAPYIVNVLAPSSPPTTTTVVDCDPNPIFVSGSTTCKATVTSASNTPTGTVSFTSTKAGIFTSSSCTLSGGECSVSFSPIEVGTHTITATYSSTSGHQGSSGTTDLYVHYSFIGLLPPYAEPPRAYKIGSSIPLKWWYADANGTVVDSSAANPMIHIKFVSHVANGEVVEVEDPGNSGLRYDTTTDMWIFNWQTKGLSSGSYEICIMSGQSGQANGPFPIQLR